MSESVLPEFRFSLKTLLIAMVVVAAGCWLVDRYISDRARFEILETDLVVDDGYLNGAISFRCSRLNEVDNIEYADVVIYVKEISDTRLMKLNVGDEFFVRYRHRGFGPIKAENRYDAFMIRELGFRREEIGGRVQLDGWAEVQVRGKKPKVSR